MPSDYCKSRQYFYNIRKCIEAEDSVELLGIKIDKNLNFNDHVSDLIRKGNKKLHALARISRYINQDKLKIIMKTFIQSQFNYCSHLDVP